MQFRIESQHAVWSFVRDRYARASETGWCQLSRAEQLLQISNLNRFAKSIFKRDAKFNRERFRIRYAHLEHTLQPPLRLLCPGGICRKYRGNIQLKLRVKSQPINKFHWCLLCALHKIKYQNMQNQVFYYKIKAGDYLNQFDSHSFFIISQGNPNRQSSAARTSSHSTKAN